MFGDVSAGRPMDVWASGCVVFETVLRSLLFVGRKPKDVLLSIFMTVGNPKGVALEYFSSLPLWGAKDGQVKADETIVQRLQRSIEPHEAEWVASLMVLKASERPSAAAALASLERDVIVTF